MLRRPGTERPGITLLEVLTAIFIMGIGMLALLTLFPLGALSMARGVRDDRAATMAANAASVATMFDIRKDGDLVSAMTDPRYKQPAAPAPLLDPDSDAYIPVDPNDPSNPVFVDPLYVLFNPNDPPRLGKIGTQATLRTPGVRRAAPGFLRGNGNALLPTLTNYWFTLQDEIEFDTFGAPMSRLTGPTTYINRPGTYSFAYMARRPRHGTAELTELTVLVYSSRVTDVLEQELTYFSTAGMWNATLARNTIFVPWPPAVNDVPFNPTEKPNLRKGTWLFDVSWVGPNPPANPTTGRTVNGHFYRAENVTEEAGGFRVELDREIKANISALTVMKNVIAVVERGTTWAP